MLKISNLTRNVKRILVIFVFAFLTLAITSCKGKNVDSIDLSKEYLSVNSYTVSNGEVWKEIKWDAASLFTDKAKEAVLSKELETIKTVMNDTNNENYKYYSERLKNYLLEDVYDLEFSLEDHYEEIEDLDDKEQIKKISAFADDVFEQKFAKMNTNEIVEALKADTKEDLDSLRKLYEHYYLDLAQELFARTKLQEEIDKKNKEYAEDKDEETVGYFTKTEVNNMYKQEYLNKGAISAVVIKFASDAEAKQTLKAFGIFVDNGKFYYLKDTPANYSEYSAYYDKFNLSKANETEYEALASKSDAAVLQLYIAMYNYIYTYRGRLDNLGVDQGNYIDQRNTTKSIINRYDAMDESKDENARVQEVYKTLENDDTKQFIIHDSKELIKTNKALYEYLTQTLVSPDYFNLKEETEADADVKYGAYSTSAQSLGEGYYMAFKIKQDVNDDDKAYKTNISNDDLYAAITSPKYETLYKNIIADLTDEKLTKDYITEKVDEACKDVKVKIFDKDIEIAYAKDHKDYSRTLSGAPDNNTIAEFKYNDTIVTLELSNDANNGAWDILEHKTGQVTAINLISKKMIKDTDQYKNIAQEDIDAFYKAIEYILASFANDGLAQSGYPASLGKYNFLKLYYHTSDIHEIVDDVFKINTVISDVLINYNSDPVVNFFDEYTQKAYNNFFSIGSTVLKVYRDTDEDGKEDDINEWKDLTTEFDGKAGVKYEDIAKQLINDVYTLVKNSSTDHKTKLTSVVADYNSSGRHDPNEGNKDSYDPIPNEWKYAKYKKLGFALKTVDITVTNSSNDIDPTIKNKLNEVYKDENFAYKDFFPSQYLEDASKDSSIVLAEDAYNYFLITSAEKPASAKYESYKDVDNIYKDLYYRYNYNTIKIDNVYNTNDQITKDQIRGFLFEQLSSQTSNLLPSDIQTALTNFLNPVLSRFQSSATQSRITLKYICKDGATLKFADAKNLERFNELKAISERKAEDYVVYESAEDEAKYNNFINWFDKIDNVTVGGNK